MAGFYSSTADLDIRSGFKLGWLDMDFLRYSSYSRGYKYHKPEGQKERYKIWPKKIDIRVNSNL